MTPKPSVSVVIPARNEQGYVGRAIDSVLRQTYTGLLETIVVDNGSTDETARVVAGEITRSPGSNIQLAREPVAGVGRAKNTGAATASGRVLIFLDGDSAMSTQLVAAVADAYDAGNRAGSVRVVTDGGTVVDRAFFRLMEFGKVHLGVRAQMLYVEKILFDDLGGFDPELRLGEDVDFLRRAHSHLKAQGQSIPIHVTRGEIRTSPRRLAANHHLGMLRMFVRWLLAFLGFGRRANY